MSADTPRSKNILRLVFAIGIVAFVGRGFEVVALDKEMTSSVANTASAVTCFFTRERTSGMNKLCFYDCMGSEAVITIKATELCPLNIKR